MITEQFQTIHADDIKAVCTEASKIDRKLNNQSTTNENMEIQSYMKLSVNDGHVMENPYLVKEDTEWWNSELFKKVMREEMIHLTL